MIRVVMDVEEIDYEAIAEKYLENKRKKDEKAKGMLGKLKQSAMETVADAVINNTSEEKKIELVNMYLEARKEKIMEKMEELAEKNGVQVKIGDIKIESVCK